MLVIGIPVLWRNQLVLIKQFAGRKKPKNQNPGVPYVRNLLQKSRDTEKDAKKSKGKRN